MVEKEVPETAQPVPASTAQPQRSPFHIVPSDYTYEKNDALPSAQKNVVDLRN